MDGCMDRWKDGQKYGWMDDETMAKWTDGWIDVWMDRFMDGLMDGWNDEFNRWMYETMDS